MRTTVDSSLTSHRGSSQRQRVLLFAGFGGLLLLMGVLGLSAIVFLRQIEVREEGIRRDYVDRSRALENLRYDIYSFGTLMRDFVSDADETLANRQRAQLRAKRREIESSASEYDRLIGSAGRAIFDQLDDDLSRWFTAVTPALEWTTEERYSRGYDFMQKHVLPNRAMLLALTGRLQQIQERRLEAASEAASTLVSSSRAKLFVLLLLTVLAGLTVAGIALWRLLRLERESQARFQEALHTRGELQRLSREIVSAQESERRRISRELHDEVGQVLSASMFSLGNLRSALNDNNNEEAMRQLQLVEDMTQRNASVVRNISLLLRPTMLDDLGFLPALKWLAREVSRTGPIRVEVISESLTDQLPEEHRTCVFRVVQEAVRNAARHSGGGYIRIFVQESERTLRLSVQDDGNGFDSCQETGLGILGMQERVAQLGGKLTVDASRGRGTTVSFELPLPEDARSEHTEAVKPPYEMSPLRTA